MEFHERTEGGWLLRDMIGGGTVGSASLGLEISLDEIYA